jgi:hypothetical protein
VCKLSRIDNYYRKHNAGRAVQGDILKDIMFIEWDVTGTDEKDITFIKNDLPYIVILSQDCDLDHDYKNRIDQNTEKQDAYLQSILVCPAYLMAEFKEGNHLKKLKMQMERKGGDNWKKIQKNIDPRYHYLPGKTQFQIPDLILDFKHYYTIPVNFVYKVYPTHYVASLEELFRESLCQRFSFYLSRIGLPDINDLEC